MMDGGIDLDVEFPKKLNFLLGEKWRYKVARGGRGSAKSWSFARALLVRGAQKKERILCTREIQKSIAQSVHQLLTDQIIALGLSSFYAVYKTEIRGDNGTEIYFSGLSDQTADTLKSFEGVTLCWVEEAQAVTEASWDILTPTIRADGSEIWVTYNPVLDSDPTHKRFALDAPANCKSVVVNYVDNPWFPDVLETERQELQRKDLKKYKNIWLGECKAAVDGAVYSDEVEALQTSGRAGNVPYDARLKVHAVWDLGWNDSMSIILVQKQASEMRIIGFMQDNHRTYEYFSELLKAKKYNWGAMWLPHDGMHRNPITATSPKETLEAFGWTVEAVPNIAIETGVTELRQSFKSFYVDKKECAALLECWRRYRQKINKLTGAIETYVHDQYSHGADASRYLALVAPLLTNHTSTKMEPINYGRRYT
jgi:phage terminase large subunit